jgi:hypothetical protein
MVGVRVKVGVQVKVKVRIKVSVKHYFEPKPSLSQTSYHLEG